MIVRSDHGHGRTVKTTKQFKKGDIVCDYNGSLLQIKALKDFERKLQTSDNMVCEYTYHFKLPDGSPACIDPNEEPDKESYGRLINHACHSWLKAEVHMIMEKPHLLMKAMQDIPAFVELSFDYG